MHYYNYKFLVVSIFGAAYVKRDSEENKRKNRKNEELFP